ncbi:unnamed protein product [Penicillium salamii]|nr:unnamed protein product [Penicillium salamii]
MTTASTEGLPEGTSATGNPAAPPTDTPAPAPETKAKPAAIEDNDEDSDFDELDACASPSCGSSSRQLHRCCTARLRRRCLPQATGARYGQHDGGGAPAADPNVQSTVDQGAEMFAKQLEDSGVPPGDFLKQLLADVMAEQSGSGAAPATAPKPQPESSASASDQPAESFNDAIKRTMGRMKESGDKATAAAGNEDDMSDDMIAQLLKAMEAGADGAGEDGDLSKMFMGMMEQLSNKEMLYEPMKELDVKFGPWLEKNKSGGSLPAEDLDRYQKQAQIVKQIVTKFEERSYSDDDPKCREYVWERMQEMQAAGSPPEELVSNPLMGDLGGAAAGMGMPDCPQQ